MMGRTAVVKYLKRESGSLDGDGDSNLEKVCLIWFGSRPPVSRMAPGYSGRSRDLPETLCMCLEKRLLISGVMKDERMMVWRKWRALPSRYQCRTLEKSQPCASFGWRFTCSSANSTCSQFCISIASVWSTIRISIELRKS